MWDPQLLTTLQTSTACYGDSYIFIFLDTKMHWCMIFTLFLRVTLRYCLNRCLHSFPHIEDTVCVVATELLRNRFVIVLISVSDQTAMRQLVSACDDSQAT
jgi:hypothetical protein